ncbi:hypothetical protein NL676_025757 [Syzygium grande]|nr:hypothetical protein NL676_025757 [Syzygium grande]
MAMAPRMVGKCGCTSGMMGYDDGTQTVMGKVGHSCVVEGMSTKATGTTRPAELLRWCRRSGGGAATRLQDAKQRLERTLIRVAGVLAEDDEWRQVGDSGYAVSASG